MYFQNSPSSNMMRVGSVILFSEFDADALTIRSNFECAQNSMHTKVFLAKAASDCCVVDTCLYNDPRYKKLQE